MGDRPQVSEVRLVEAGDGVAITVRLAGGTDTIKTRPDGGFSADLSRER
jgi:hypothetical protein